MTELDILRAVGEVGALIGALLAAMRWTAGRFLTLLHEVQQTRLEVGDLRGDVTRLDKHQQEMNGSVAQAIERVAKVEGILEGLTRK